MTEGAGSSKPHSRGSSADTSSSDSEPTRRETIGFKEGDLILGRYRINGMLGQGGMGVVYRCQDEVGGILVALKALPAEVSRNTAEMEEIRENFRLVSRLAHPNIAQIRTLERDPVSGDYYLIMECVEGMSLRQWRKRRNPDNGRVAVIEALPVLRQVADALDYAHSQKIIHRDIKPSNIMLRLPFGKTGTTPDDLTDEPTVKVLDFGLAAQIQTSMSRVSVVKYDTSGTGPYMAPEQWRGQHQDAATDQYALAVVAYEFLSGKCPFISHEIGVMREAVLHDTAERIEGLSDGAWGAITRGLSKERKDRFASCREFVDALDPQVRRGGERRGLGPWVLGVLGGVVLAVVLGGLVVRPAWRAHRQRVAEKERQARLDMEKQQKIRALLAETEGRIEADQAEEALTRLGELRTLDAENPDAKRLQSKLESRVSERKARLAKVDAEMAWERLKKQSLDEGQGVGTKLFEIEKQLRLTLEAYKRSGWGEAFTGYRTVMGQVADVERLEAERVEVRKALTAMQDAQARAATVKAATDAQEDWEAAGRLSAAGTRAFEAGQFSAATTAYHQAEVSYRTAFDKAGEMAAYRQSRAAFESELARCNLAVLRQYGGADWEAVDTQQRQGAASAGNPALGSKVYDQALAALPDAVRVATAAAELAKQKADEKAAQEAAAAEAARKRAAERAVAEEAARRKAAHDAAEQAAKEKALAEYQTALSAAKALLQVAQGLPQGNPQGTAALKKATDLLGTFEATEAYGRLGTDETRELTRLHTQLTYLLSIWRTAPSLPTGTTTTVTDTNTVATPAVPATPGIRAPLPPAAQETLPPATLEDSKRPTRPRMH